MGYSPSERPSFTEVVFELNSVLSDTLGILHRFLAASTAAQQLRGHGVGGLPQPAVEEGPQPSDPFRD